MTKHELSVVRLVVVRDHYGTGVTAFEANAQGVTSGEPRPFPSFDAAIAHWQVSFGLGEPEVIDERYGRWLVQFE